MQAKKALRVSAASFAVAILMVMAAPLQANAEPPEAVIVTVPPNIAGLPVIFSALGSGGEDTRGLTFEYDFDNDGVYESQSDSAIAEHTYLIAGPRTVRMRVTDEFQRTSETTVDFTVAEPSTVIGPPMFPAEGGPVLTGTSIDSDTVPSGGTVNLTVAGLPPGQTFRVRLVDAVEPDPALAPTVLEFGEFATSPVELKITSTAPGKYRVVVVRSSDFSTVDLGLEVTQPVSLAAPLRWIAYIAASAGLVGLGSFLWLRMKRRNSVAAVDQ